MLANLFRTKNFEKCYYIICYKVLTDEISATLDSSQLREQARFLIGYSTTDQIHVINQVLEKYTEYTKPLYIAFID